MPLNDGGVFVDADMALPLGVQHLGIAVLAEKAAQILALLSQGTVHQNVELGHVPGIVPEPFHGQQVMARDGLIRSFQTLPSLSVILRTGQPYRAISRALTIRLNATGSTTSVLARSLTIVPEESV